MFTSEGWILKSEWHRYRAYRAWRVCRWWRTLQGSVQSSRAVRTELNIEMMPFKTCLKITYLDFNLVESLAVVNANNGTGHLRDDDHIAQVCFDNVGFLIRRAFLLLLTQFLDQSQRLTLKTTTDFPPDAAREQLHQLFIAHVKELIQVHSTVSELTESPLFLQLSCCSLKRKNTLWKIWPCLSS